MVTLWQHLLVINSSTKTLHYLCNTSFIDTFTARRLLAEIWKLVKEGHNFCILCGIVKRSLNCNKKWMNVIIAYGWKLQKYYINSIIIIAVLLTAVAPHHSLLFRDINLCFDGGSFGHWGWGWSAWSELWRSSILKCAIYECHRKWAYDGVTNFNQSSLLQMMLDKTKFWW